MSIEVKRNGLPRSSKRGIYFLPRCVYVCVSVGVSVRRQKILAHNDKSHTILKLITQRIFIRKFFLNQTKIDRLMPSQSLIAKAAHAKIEAS